MQLKLSLYNSMIEFDKTLRIIFLFPLILISLLALLKLLLIKSINGKILLSFYNHKIW